MAKIPTLTEIVTALSEVYDDRGCVNWLHAPQRVFARGEGAFPSALDLIAIGRSEEVMQRIEQLQAGNFG